MSNEPTNDSEKSRLAPVQRLVRRDVKCKHCGKAEDVHASKGNCPIGHKHRSLGYCQFADTVFAPKD